MTAPADGFAKSENERVGKCFIAPWGKHGDLIWQAQTEPIRAEDGSSRLFVWAKAVGRPEIRNRRGRAGFKLLRGEHVFFMPVKWMDEITPPGERAESK